MTDWQGNKVIEGDTVVMVYIKKKPLTMNVFVKDPKTGELKEYTAVEKNERVLFDWSPFYETVVFKHEGLLYMDIPDDRNPNDTVAFPVDFVQENNHDPHCIFCIKRITDRQELFFANWFKPYMN